MKRSKSFIGLLGSVMLVFISTSVLKASSSSSASTLTPDQALKYLKEGHKQFLRGQVDPASFGPKKRKYTALNGQHPYATIMGCSDSREPLEHIFSAGVGDIFVIRVAGNVADTDEIGSIEYGVEHLSTPVLLILGHKSCGAVTAVVKDDHVTGSIPPLVDNIIKPVKEARKQKGEMVTPELINYAVGLNVFQSIEDVLKKSPGTAELVRQGKLKVIGAVYDLETGDIEWMGQHPRQKEILSSKNISGLFRWKELSLSVASLILIMMLFLKLFVADKRLLKGIRMKGRIYFAFSAIALGLGFTLYMLIFILKQPQWLEVATLTFINLIFSIIFARMIIDSMRRFINSFKK